MLLKFQHEEILDLPHNSHNPKWGLCRTECIFRSSFNNERLWKRLNNLPSAIQHDTPVWSRDSLFLEIFFLKDILSVITSYGSFSSDWVTVLLRWFAIPEGNWRPIHTRLLFLMQFHFFIFHYNYYKIIFIIKV